MRCVLRPGSHDLALRSPRRRPAARPSRTDRGCAKASLNLVEDGQLSSRPTTRPSSRGGAAAPSRRTGSSTTLRLARVRVRGRLRDREALGYEGAGRLAGRPVPEVFATGKKSFDFYLAQVSNRPERRKAVTFSASYYVVNQAVAALKSNPISKVARSPG